MGLDALDADRLDGTGPPPPPALGDPAARCAPRVRSWAGSMRTARWHRQGEAAPITPRARPGRSMAPRAGSWAGSMGTARWHRPTSTAGPRRGRSPRGRGAGGARCARCGPARWHRPTSTAGPRRSGRSMRPRARPALDASRARSWAHRRGRGRADHPEGGELVGLDGTGPPPPSGHEPGPGPVRDRPPPPGEAGRSMAPRARSWAPRTPAHLHRQGEAALIIPRRGRSSPGEAGALDGAEGEELGGLDARRLDATGAPPPPALGDPLRDLSRDMSVTSGVTCHGTCP